MKKELIFLGPPASGKGTQTNRLSAELNLPHVDTGSMLRAAIAEGTEAGKTAKGFMDEGKLVPTEIVAQIIRDRLNKSDCDNGFILDGYPRSIEQAQILESILNDINEGKEYKLLVINIDVDEKLLIERIIYRRSCAKCGKIYNLKTLPPKDEKLCDDCDGELIQRKDDTKDVAQKRLDTYHSQTQPLIDFYGAKNLLVNVNGNGDIDDIYAEILSHVK